MTRPEMAERTYREELPKSKGLTPDQKKLHWEVYAQKTLRQEEMFKRVFKSVFEGQSKT